VLKVQPQGEDIGNSIRLNDNSGASETSGDEVFEEAVDRLRSYSFISIGESRKKKSKCMDRYS
jgi:hypothetical protein